MPAPRELPTFAKNLATLIAQRHLSVPRAANLIGWPKADLSGVLKGRLDASSHDIEHVAAVFGLTVDELSSQDGLIGHESIDRNTALAQVLLKVARTSNPHLVGDVSNECAENITSVIDTSSWSPRDVDPGRIVVRYLQDVAAGGLVMSPVVLACFARRLDVPAELLLMADEKTLATYRKAARLVSSAQSAARQMHEVTDKYNDHLESLEKTSGELPDEANDMLRQQYPTAFLRLPATVDLPMLDEV